MIPVLRRQSAQKFTTVWDCNKEDVTLNFLRFTADLWNFFLQTGRHQTGFQDHNTSVLFYSIFDGLKETPDLLNDTVHDLLKRVLIFYDDAFYKYERQDESTGRWVIVEDATIKTTTENTEFGGFSINENFRGRENVLIGVSRCEDTDQKDFILKQSDNAFCSSGYDLYKKTKTSTDFFFDEWLFKRCKKEFVQVL